MNWFSGKTIKVYTMEYSSTLTSAIGYARNGKLEEGMKWQIPEENFNWKVSQLMEVIEKGTDLPPQIVHYDDGGFELNDGNHRHEAYKRLGIEEYFVIVWITEKEEYAEFMEKYSGYME